MDTINSDPERFVPCPYDSAHSAPAFRLQYHIQRCKLNHPNSTKKECPFNATHIIESIEFEHHVATCPSSGNLKIGKYLMEHPKQVGVISLEEACAIQPVVIEDEDWNGNHPTYNALAVAESRPILRTQVGLSKAKRKKYRRAERERLAALETGGTTGPKTNSNVKKQPMDFEKPLRAPKQSSKALSPSSSRNCTQELKPEVGIDKNVASKSPNSSPRGKGSPKRSTEDFPRETAIKETSSKINQENQICEQAKEMNENNITKCLVERNTNLIKNLSISNGNKASVSIKKEEDSSATENKEQLDWRTMQKKISLRCAANFSAPHKISTGRGFMLASQKLRRWEEENSVVKTEQESKDFGYDDE